MIHEAIVWSPYCNHTKQEASHILNECYETVLVGLEMKEFESLEVNVDRKGLTINWKIASNLEKGGRQGDAACVMRPIH
jgi:hypothetical protein